MATKGHCDGCDKDRSDIKSCGRDADGEPDAPDLCFICRKEGERGRLFDRGLGRYVRPEQGYDPGRDEVDVAALPPPSEEEFLWLEGQPGDDPHR